MAKEIKLYVQRWSYERGNYQIIIENAWNLKFRYNQERVTVNGERILDHIPNLKVLLFWRTIFEDTILDSTGELNLKVQWRSGLNTCKARLLIDNEKQDWTSHFEKKWTGSKGNWPDLEYFSTDELKTKR